MVNMGLCPTTLHTLIHFGLFKIFILKIR